MNIGNRITELRNIQNMTQQELASLLFVSDKTVSSWEANRTEPNLEILVKMSGIFSCNVSYLIYGNIEKNNIETEIRVKLTEKEYQELELFFINRSQFLNETKQVDTYFQPTYRNFVNKEKIFNKEVITEWLRIGQRGNKNILNYKNWYDNYCDEYEVEIDDVESLSKIFKILGIEEIAIVDKVRKTYFYLNKYEIALDYVKDLGYFIEIEVKKYTRDAMTEYDQLLKIAKDLSLNLNAIDKRGYPYYIIEKKYQ